MQANYARTDPASGHSYLTFTDGFRFYFPNRVARTVKFRINLKSTDDQFARLYADNVVDAINHLNSKVIRYQL